MKHFNALIALHFKFFLNRINNSLSVNLNSIIEAHSNEYSKCKYKNFTL